MKQQSLGDDSGFHKFLETEPAAVLSLPIDEAGTIHSAGLLFALNDKAFEFIFITSSNTEKCQLLNKKKNLKASCVVGTQKGTQYSLQMRGIISLQDYADSDNELDIYEKKFGKRTDDVSDANQVVLVFKPDWARYTNYVSTDWKDGYNRIFLKTK